MNQTFQELTKSPLRPSSRRGDSAPGFALNQFHRTGLQPGALLTPDLQIPRRPPRPHKAEIGMGRGSEKQMNNLMSHRSAQDLRQEQSPFSETNRTVVEQRHAGARFAPGSYSKRVAARLRQSRRQEPDYQVRWQFRPLTEWPVRRRSTVKPYQSHIHCTQHTGRLERRGKEHGGRDRCMVVQSNCKLTGFGIGRPPQVTPVDRGSPRLGEPGGKVKHCGDTAKSRHTGFTSSALRPLNRRGALKKVG